MKVIPNNLPTSEHFVCSNGLTIVSEFDFHWVLCMPGFVLSLVIDNRLRGNQYFIIKLGVDFVDIRNILRFFITLAFSTHPPITSILTFSFSTAQRFCALIKPKSSILMKSFLLLLPSLDMTTVEFKHLL